MRGLSPQRLHAVARGMWRILQAPSVDVVAHHCTVFSIHLLGDHDLVSAEAGVRILHDAVVVGGTRRPRQVVRPRVLHPVGEQVQRGSEGLLNTLVVEQLTAQAPTVGQDGVAPLVVLLISIEMLREHRNLDLTALAQLLTRDACLFAPEMTRFANCGSIVEVVASVREQSTLDDVMSVKFDATVLDSATHHALVPIPREYGLAELGSGQQRAHGGSYCAHGRRGVKNDPSLRLTCHALSVPTSASAT